MDRRQGVNAVFDGDEVDSLLSGQFYAPLPDQPPQRAKLLAAGTEKPSHYKVICISPYTQDLENLDRMVDELKGRGLTKASRSALIRYALGAVDLDKVPRGL